MQDQLEGRVDLFFDAPITSGPHIRSGELRALAIASPNRAPQFADVPPWRKPASRASSSKSGSRCTRERNAEPVVTRLNQEFVKAMRRRSLQALRRLGLDVVTSTPAELAKSARTTMRLGKVVRDSGAKAENDTRTRCESGTEQLPVRLA